MVLCRLKDLSRCMEYGNSEENLAMLKNMEVSLYSFPTMRIFGVADTATGSSHGSRKRRYRIRNALNFANLVQDIMDGEMFKIIRARNVARYRNMANIVALRPYLGKSKCNW